MRISLKVTVDIDAAKWSEYSGAEGAAEIREDVKAYLVSLMQGADLIECTDGSVERSQ